jgi:hypothetical protein
MRENRTYGSEGGEPSNGSLPYPYSDNSHVPKYTQTPNLFLDEKFKMKKMQLVA